MPLFPTNQTPGFGVAIESEESQVYFGGREGSTRMTYKPILLDSTSIMVTPHSPVTTIVGGCVIVKTAGDIFVPLGHTAGEVWGILPNNVDMLGDGGVATDRWTHLFTSGLLITGEVHDDTDDVLLVDAIWDRLVTIGFVLDDPGLLTTWARIP